MEGTVPVSDYRFDMCLAGCSVALDLCRGAYVTPSTGPVLCNVSFNVHKEQHGGRT